jgi:hypothetical protein
MNLGVGFPKAAVHDPQVSTHIRRSNYLNAEVRLPLRQLVRRHRSSYEITLPQLVAHVEQNIEMLLRLDAFCHGMTIKCPRQADNTLHYSRHLAYTWAKICNGLKVINRHRIKINEALYNGRYNFKKGFIEFVEGILYSKKLPAIHHESRKI